MNFHRCLIAFAILHFIIFSDIHSYAFSDAYVRHQEPELLSYDELVRLCRNPKSGGAIEQKVEKIFRTPFINNEAFYAGIRPHRPMDQKLGPAIRVASWNIEKSLGLESAILAFTDPEKFKTLIRKKYSPDSEEFQEVMKQRAMLDSLDIVLLQEMDIGVKRSEYRNSVKELAEALKMNYAYGTEQLEIDPINLGMKEEFLYEDNTLDLKMYKIFEVDPEKYQGLFGSAVLSRYPIKKVELFQLKHQAYDWYHQEKSKIPFLEKIRRQTASQVFLEKMMREMKVGGRVFFRVDLHVPELPGQTLSVINVHLEIKCPPKEREYQMYEILSYIYDIKNPVILAGDFNAAPDDLSPTSVKKEIRRALTDPNFLFGQALTLMLPQGLMLNLSRGFANITKNYQDPTTASIPLIAPNPVRGLFKAIENFRFADGKAFDFRGDSSRSINGKSEKLANSNERDAWGFKMTFRLDRTIANWIGKYRLDWMLVKPVNLTDPRDEHASYRFAPHFAVTLEEMNNRLEMPISDHSPNIIDLPLEEPKIE